MKSACIAAPGSACAALNTRVQGRSGFFAAVFIALLAHGWLFFGFEAGTRSPVLLPTRTQPGVEIDLSAVPPAPSTGKTGNAEPARESPVRPVRTESKKTSAALPAVKPPAKARPQKAARPVPVAERHARAERKHNTLTAPPSSLAEASARSGASDQEGQPVAPVPPVAGRIPGHAAGAGPESVQTGTFGSPQALSNPRPEYPALARSRGQQGTVALMVDVGADGVPLQIRVQSSSGHPLLDRAALKAVWKWRFKPALEAGVAVPGQVLVPVDFRLTD